MYLNNENLANVQGHLSKFIIEHFNSTIDMFHCSSLYNWHINAKCSTTECAIVFIKMVSNSFMRDLSFGDRQFHVSYSWLEYFILFATVGLTLRENCQECFMLYVGGLKLFRFVYFHQTEAVQHFQWSLNIPL